MTKYFPFGFLILILLLSQPVFSQFVDNFDDGDFTNNPAWSGDAGLFVVNATSALQLNDETVSQSEAYLSVAATTGMEANWNFRVSLDFSPSGSNRCRVYLGASQADLTGSLDGYYIQVGGITGDQDALELIRQNGTSTTTLISGTPGAVANEPIDVSIAVSRNSAGLWTLQADYAGGQNFVDEGTAVDISFDTGQFFGWVCNYTSTRNDAFRIDDIRIDPIIQDLDPPMIAEVTIVSASQLTLGFNEAIDFSTIDESNFQIDNGISVAAATMGAAPNELMLSLNPNLTNQTDYTLTASDIADPVGNVLTSQDINFTYIETVVAQEFDLLINEFMADPTPQVGLPNAEYIELFNNTNSTFNLREYMLSSGGAPQVLPDFLLEAGQYVLITSEDEVVNFSIFGEVLGLSSFPTLSNAGDEILLQDLEGNIVHQINYTLDWYQDSSKEDGGFSIELINPTQACKQAANYRASENLSGGTPAVVNSVLDNVSDLTAPSLLNIFTINSTSLLLTFDEPLDAFGAEEILNYLLTAGIDVATATVQADGAQVLLDLASEIQTGEILGLQFQNVSDCLGNSASLSDTIFFAIPEIPLVEELLINEILFNPVSGGVDFVEIYNPTDKVFNLADIQIANLESSINEVVSLDIDFLILPETYVCITEDKSQTLSQYPIDDPTTLFENILPNFDDDAGNVTLITLQNNIPLDIDVFNYSEDFHTGFISDQNGVSLERISFDSPTDLASNWTSAAQSTGFATPGYENAQVIGNPTVSAGDFFEIINPTFSPDQDGFKDFTQVNFTLDQVDYFATMTIYDDEGREIAQILPFQTIAPSGTVRWDGTDSDGDVANMGIYVLYIQLLDPNGNQMEFKEPIVVARRLN